MSKSATTEKRSGRPRLAPRARRALIDKAATEVFAERGYEAATMQQIAKAAGVVASVIYDHYSSKRDLYVALVGEHSRVLREKTIRAPENADIRGELANQVDDFFRSIEEDPFLWRTMFREPPADPKIAAAHRLLQAKAGQAIVEVLKAGASKRGQVERIGDATAHSMVAEFFKGALNGLASWWWDNRQVERGAVVEIATALLWQGLSQRIGEPP